MHKNHHQRYIRAIYSDAKDMKLLKVKRKNLRIGYTEENRNEILSSCEGKSGASNIFSHP